MTSSTAEQSTQSTQDSPELFGHPVGLYICFATELWERFSFYGMKYLLLLYLTKYHLFSDGAGLDVLGAYAGLVYSLPVIGGILADRYLGMRKAVVCGAILLSLGHLLMAVEGHQAMYYAAGTLLSADLSLADGTILAAGTVLAEQVTIRDTAALKVFYLALTLIVMGVGFLKPNISTIVGKLYADNDSRRDSGFTIFYMGINIGAFVATLFCGWLGETYGWNYGFGAAGIGMIIGLLVFLLGQKYLYGHADPASPEKLKEKAIGPINKEWLIYLCSLPMMVLVWMIVQREPVVHVTQNIFLIIAIVGIILFSMLHNKTANRNGAYIFAVITVAIGICSALFQTGFISIDPSTSEKVLYAAVGCLLAFIIYGFKFYYSKEFSRTVVLMVLIISTIVFWALFEQSAGSMTLFADRVTDRVIFSSTLTANDAWIFKMLATILALVTLALAFLSYKKNKISNSKSLYIVLGIVSALVLPFLSTVTAFAMLVIAGFYKSTKSSMSSFENGIITICLTNLATAVAAIAIYLLCLSGDYAQLTEATQFIIEPTASNFGALNAFFIVLLAPFFAWLWTWLGKNNIEPSTPVKFALGIIQVGLGFGALILGAHFPDEAGKVAAIWLVLAYLLHTTAELCLSPVGLSAVTKLSIPRVVGVSMGTWFLATALSETVATRIGKLAAIDTSGGEITDIASAVAVYTELFNFLLYLGLGVGIFMLIISPLLKKGMHGVN